MLAEPNNTHTLPRDVANGIEGSAFEANSATPCPLCDHDHYCFLWTNGKGDPVKSICQWTEEPPDGWDRVGTAKDGRGIFAKRGLRQKRRNYPDIITLSPRPMGDAPQWRDISTPLDQINKGHRVIMRQSPEVVYEVISVDWLKHRVICQKPGGLGKLDTPLTDVMEIAYRDPVSGAKEQTIEYHYPAVDHAPLGKVVRRQWSDRRRDYEKGTKTKEIRPHHWQGTPEDGQWKFGKGNREWPLYREQEAREAILKGEILFAVGGEQAVETYRGLGLSAVTCQGGESNYRQISDRLKDTFDDARANNLRPLLVIHPDNDITGENTFSDALQRECDLKRIPACRLEPLELWNAMPIGGDIYDWVHKSGLTTAQILRQLENCIDEAIDRQEMEIRGRQQRARWQAPEAHHGELGFWREKKLRNDEPDLVFHPATDFDFQIERELISSDGGGLLLQVKRTDDRSQKRCYIASTDFSSVQKFKDALKKAIGGAIVCNLSPHQLEALLRVRLHEYRITRRGKSFKLIDRIGQQGDGTWVFKHVQFTVLGETTDETQSLWVWNSAICDESGGFRPPAIAAQSPEAIKRLVDCLRRAMGGNFYLTMLVLGYAAAGVHYQIIQEVEGAFPILNLYGDPGSGKTTAAEAGLSMVGQHKEGLMRSISVSAAYERLKLAGGLLHCLDDPERTPELDEFLKGFYNGNSRVVRGRDSNGFNVQKPHSPLMVTSNHACGENSAATQSRLVRLFFPKVGDGDRDAFRELPMLYAEASGCLTQLIKFKYPQGDIYALEHELSAHLPHAHQRIAKSLSLVLHYAMEVARIAGIDPEPIKTYVAEVVCTQVNDPDEAGDSLRDFLERLFILQSESKVGEWNTRWIDREDGRSLAIYLPGVWTQMDKAFNLAYNRKIIESLLVSRGIRKSRQRFHINEDESRAYQRAKLTTGSNSDPNPPETTVRWCYEIPYSMLQDASEKAGGAILRSTDQQGGGEGTQTQSERGDSLCTNRDQQRSTEINRDQQDHPPNGVLTPSVDQQDFKYQQGRSTGKSPEPSKFEPPSDPLLISLIAKCTTSDRLQNPDDPCDSQCSSLEGKIVVPKATASWLRHKEATKLPWRSLSPSLKDAKEIPLNRMPDDLFHEIQDLSRVVKVSSDGRRCKVVNLKTARTSFFKIDQLDIMPDGYQGDL